MPFLKSITLKQTEQIVGYPVNIPAFLNGINIDVRTNVTLFVGENGSGKSTLLEAIATLCGFNMTGGGRNHCYNQDEPQTHSELANNIKLSWFPKVTTGFFMRAESFFNFATYLDDVADYGNKSLHAQSHGESFLSLFTNRMQKGIYLLDEPEAALSPQRQLSFMTIIHDLETAGKAQFIIATHSPMLLCYPQATILNFGEDGITEVAHYTETEHYRITKTFLDAPERYFQYLFSDEESE
ncbi:MAG: AAA family ATPase [Deltaproteobacteria bacterium]|nr:AAA family ATPase [Deltaproteobacteria bacterium]